MRLKASAGGWKERLESLAGPRFNCSRLKPVPWRACLRAETHRQADTATSNEFDSPPRKDCRLNIE